MKKLIVAITLVLSMSILMIGYATTKSTQELPELTISVGEKQLDYVVAKNKWNGDIYDREDTFISILKEQNKIPIFEYESIVEVSYKGNPPDVFTVYDILIDENGRQIYTDKEIKKIPVVLYGGKYAFKIERHFASGLSSYYEPNKKDIRGFRMIASWGENECEYAFIIRTD